MAERHQRRSSSGFSIVELMVSAIIGLIAVLAIFEVFTAFERQKRTTSGGGDAQTNGTLALFMLERDIRQAGYGFAALNILNCNARAYNAQRTPPEFTMTPVAPVVINPAGYPAGDANTDVVAITYGDTSGMGGGVSFRQQAGASAEYQVTNRAGFQVGEMVIASQPGLDCTIAQVTELPASGACGVGGGVGQTDIVIHNAGMFRDPEQNCNNVPSQWNKPGGLGVTYTNGTLYSLGRLPKSFAYAVRGGNLTVCSILASDCTDAAKTSDATVWVPIANNIVALRAEYGRDTGGPPMTGVVNTYDQTTPTEACGWARILVIRLAVVARSPQWEKAVVTTSPPQLGRGRLRPERPDRLAALPLPDVPDRHADAQRDLDGGTGLMLRRLQLQHRLIREVLARWFAAQRGAVLFIALIALVAMTLAGIALVRSVDTATVISGNISFRESATHSADTGTEAAVTWLSTNNAGATLFTDHLDVGYVANGLAYQEPPPGQNWEQYWSNTLLPAGQIEVLPTDAAGNTVSYVIHRMCYSSGDPLAPATGCATSLLQTATEGSGKGAGVIALQGSTQVYYRVTSRVAGPKGTVSYVQTMILM